MHFGAKSIDYLRYRQTSDPTNKSPSGQKPNQWEWEFGNTGQVKYAGPDDPNTIRFLGLNLDNISKKQSSNGQPEGGVTIYQLEYVVETLEKFEGQFQLRMRTSAKTFDELDNDDSVTADSYRNSDLSERRTPLGKKRTQKTSTDYEPND
eukprot:4040462-Amphidinium_carterae.3